MKVRDVTQEQMDAVLSETRNQSMEQVEGDDQKDVLHLFKLATNSPEWKCIQQTFAKKALVTGDPIKFVEAAVSRLLAIGMMFGWKLHSQAAGGAGAERLIEVAQGIVAKLKEGEDVSVDLLQLASALEDVVVPELEEETSHDS